jgi:hypothetical protein
MTTRPAAAAWRAVISVPLVVEASMSVQRV